MIPHFYNDIYLLEIFKAAHGRVVRPRETDWEFCRPPLAQQPSSGLHFLRTHMYSSLLNSGRPRSRLLNYRHVIYVSSLNSSNKTQVNAWSTLTFEKLMVAQVVKKFVSVHNCTSLAHTLLSNVSSPHDITVRLIVLSYHAGVHKFSKI